MICFRLLRISPPTNQPYFKHKITPIYPFSTQNYAAKFRIMLKVIFKAVGL